MEKRLISINDLPPDGKEFEVTDQSVWEGPISEFKMDCRIVKPLSMKAFAQRVEEGLLIRGELKGEVAMPCNRCAEEALAAIDSEFSEYEELAAEGAEHGGEEGCIVYDRDAPMLNLAELAWEQLMLALPAQPLCKDDCKGLCPQCGANLNLDACACEPDQGDPRMAALRGVKVARK